MAEINMHAPAPSGRAPGLTQRLIAVCALSLQGRDHRSDVDVVASLADSVIDDTGGVLALAAAIEGSPFREKSFGGRGVGGASIFDLTQWPALSALPSSAVIVLGRQEFAGAIATRTIFYMGTEFVLDIDPDAIRTMQEHRILEISGIGGGRQVKFLIIVLSTDSELWADRPIVDEVLLSPLTMTDFLALPVVPGVVGRPYRVNLTPQQTSEVMFSGGTVLKLDERTVLRIVVARTPEDLLRPGDRSVQFVWGLEALRQKDTTRRLLDTLETLLAGADAAAAMRAAPPSGKRALNVRLGVSVPVHVTYQPTCEALAASVPVVGEGGVIQSCGRAFLVSDGAVSLGKVQGIVPDVARAVSGALRQAAGELVRMPRAARLFGLRIAPIAAEVGLVAYVPFENLIPEKELEHFILRNEGFLARELPDGDLKAGLRAYIDLHGAREETQVLRELESELEERSLLRMANLLEPKPIRDEDFEFDPNYPNDIARAKLKPRAALPELGVNRVLNAGAVEVARLSAEITRQRLSDATLARRFMQHMIGRRVAYIGRWLLSRDDRMDHIYRLAEAAGCGLPRAWSSGSVLGVSGADILVDVRPDADPAVTDLLECMQVAVARGCSSVEGDIILPLE